jgi:uncharacterized protein (DUF433 family)
MPAVRLALSLLSELDLALWSEDTGHAVVVDLAGNIHVGSADETHTLTGQAVMPEMLNLIAPFETGTASGPDLQRPRPDLRIVPGKLAGSPHVYRTRVETQALAALSRRGMAQGNIYKLYPALEPAAVNQALDLERQLDRNLGIAA